LSKNNPEVGIFLDAQAMGMALPFSEANPKIVAIYFGLWIVLCPQANNRPFPSGEFVHQLLHCEFISLNSIQQFHPNFMAQNPFIMICPAAQIHFRSAQSQRAPPRQIWPSRHDWPGSAKIGTKV